MLPVPCGAARSYSETRSLTGLRPPLKYGLTGVTRMRNVYSGAGATPITSPEPIINGRTYRVAPEPKGGTQAALAETTCLTASTNLSLGTGHLEALGRVIHTLSVHVGTEADDAAVLGGVGLQALKDLLAVMEDAAALGNMQGVVGGQAASSHLPSFQ